MIVLDANILIRAVLGRVRELLERYAPSGVRFFAPDEAFEDAEKHLPELLTRRGKPIEDLPDALAYLRQLVEEVDQELYGEFEQAARARLRGRDEED